MSFLQYGAKALQICSAVQNMDAPTVLYDLETSLKANLFALADKQLFDKGWRGQYPPYNFAKEKGQQMARQFSTSNTVSRTGHKIPKINDIVGTKLSHISPIDKMNKGESMIPLINETSCL